MNKTRHNRTETARRSKRAVDGRRYEAHTMQVRNGHLIKSDTGRYFSMETLPIDSLFQRNIITEEEHRAGMDIISLREVALSSLGYAKMREALHWLGGAGEPDICPHVLYLAIMHNLSKAHSRMIDRLCFAPVRESDYGWINHCRKTVRESFEALQKSVDETRNTYKMKSEERLRTPRV